MGSFGLDELRGELAHTNPGYLEGFGVRQTQNLEVGDVVFGFVSAVVFFVFIFSLNNKNYEQDIGETVGLLPRTLFGKLLYLKYSDTSLNQTPREIRHPRVGIPKQVSIYTP